VSTQVRSPLTGRRLRSLAAATLVAVAGTLVACSSDEADAPTPTPAIAATPALLVASPHALESYRYTVSVSALLGALSAETPDALADQSVSVEIEGSRINPDREQSTSSVELGPVALTVETILIGDRQWVRDGTRPWAESAGGGMDILGGMDFRPAALFSDDDAEYAALAERLAAYPSTADTIDGMATLHFTFTQAEFFEVFQDQGQLVPPDVDAALAADVWLSEEFGTPVRLLVVGTASDGTEVLRLQLDLHDLNGDEIAIEPPI